MGWVFQGSPEKFDIDDYLSRYPELVYWRTPRYSKEIAIGDRAFIWRAGTESGAVAIGTVTEVPVPRKSVIHPDALSDDLWIAEVPDPDEVATGIQLEEIRLGTDEQMVPREIVKRDRVLGSTPLIRMPNGTVFRLTETETNALERLWGVSGAVVTGSSIQEGDRRLRSHYVRERSSRLRRDKLNDFRKSHGSLHCEVCLEGRVQRYPESLGGGIFEVHHRAPLAVASTPVRTKLSDLAVLCANCHRSVHSTADVEANFNALVQHFSRANLGLQPTADDASIQFRRD